MYVSPVIASSKTASLAIVSAGPLLLFTNYWESPLARRGEVFCSVVGSSVRILFPEAFARSIKRLNSVREVHLHALIQPLHGGLSGLRLRWEDQSATPFSVEVDLTQLALEDGKNLGDTPVECHAFVPDREGSPVRAGRWPVRVFSEAVCPAATGTNVRPLSNPCRTHRQVP